MLGPKQNVGRVKRVPCHGYFSDSNFLNMTNFHYGNLGSQSAAAREAGSTALVCMTVYIHYLLPQL